MLTPRPVLAVLLAFAVLGWLSSDALACCHCDDGPVTSEEGFSTAHAVFVGKVASTTDYLWPIPHPLLSLLPPVPNRWREKRYTFEVLTSWKGVASSRAVVVSGRGYGDCGVAFDAGRTYLMFAKAHPTRDLYADICSRHMSLSDAADDLKYLSTLPKVPLSPLPPRRR